MKKGILVVNLGTPQSPNPKDVKIYLDEFLMDPFVIDIPWPLRALLVKGIILNTRPKKSAHAYKQIWTDKGSPLAFHTHEFVDKLRAQIPDLKIEVGMRYGQPSLESGMQKLIDQGVREIFIFQMYPQFAWASSASVEDKVKKIAISLNAKASEKIEIKFSEPFFKEPEFISSFANILGKHMSSADPYVLMSFHGIPERHLGRVSCEAKEHCLQQASCCELSEKTSKLENVYNRCYRAQCFATAEGIAKKMGLAPGRWSVSFQSRLGRTPWLKPFTDFVIEELAAKGEKDVLVMCPSFVSDCLETLEEIQIRAREDFEKFTGGKGKLKLVPSLNSDPDWVKSAARILHRQLLIESSVNPFLLRS